MPVSAALKQFLLYLSAGMRVPRPENEEWGALIDRISVPGQAAEIHEETYYYFLEVLPPKYQSGGMFAFAEGAETLRIFWRYGDKHFCRQLTDDETRTFCGLAHIPLPD